MADPQTTLDEYLKGTPTIEEHLKGTPTIEEYLSPQKIQPAAPAAAPVPAPPAAPAQQEEWVESIKYPYGEIPVTSQLPLTGKVTRRRSTDPETYSAAIKIEAGEDADRIPTKAEAERILEPKWWQSLLLQLEMFDYARGLTWWGTSGLMSALPDADTKEGKELQKAAGKAAGVAAKVLPSAVSPLLGSVSGEETSKAIEDLGETIYRQAAAGTLYEKPRHFHGGNIVFGDAPKKLPNVSGDLILDYTLPRDEARKLAQVARKEGNTKTASFMDLMADNEIFRASMGIVPEIVLDPMWAWGPAKGAQIVQRGGKVYQVNSVLTEAANAVVKISPEVANNKAQSLVVDLAGATDEAASVAAREYLESAVAKGKQKATEYAENAAKYEVQAKDPAAVRKAAENELVQTKAAIEDYIKRYSEDVPQPTENIIRALGYTVDEIGKKRAQQFMKTDRAGGLQTLRDASAKIDQSLLGMDNKKAAKYLSAMQKQSSSWNRYYSAQASAIQRALDLTPKALTAQAQIKRGLSVHVPLTKISGSVGLGPKTSTLVPKVSLGDTAARIAERMGLQVDDLAVLNKTDISGLESMVQAGQRITVGMGTQKGILGSLGSFGNMPLIRFVGDKTDYVKTFLSQSRLDDIISRPPETYTAGERLAVFLDTPKALKAPMALMDFLGKFLGTRWMQPWLASRSAAQNLMYWENRGSALNQMKSMSPSQRWAVRLKKTAPELWANYQSALSKFQNSILSDRDRIRQWMQTWAMGARRVAAARLKENPGLGQYDGSNVLNEVADIMESGAGRFPEELAPVVSDIKDFLKEFSERHKLDLEEVRQALVAIVRHGEGDIEKYKEVVEDLKKTVILTEKAKEADKIVVGLEKVVGDLKTTPAKMEEIKKAQATLENLKKEAKKRAEKQVAADLSGLIEKLTAAKAEIKTTGVSGSLDEAIKMSTERLGVLKQQHADQWAERARKRPVIRAKVKDSSEYVRRLREWEEDLWASVRPKISRFSKEDQLRAVFATLAKDGVYKFDSDSVLARSQEYMKLREAYVRQGLGKAKAPKAPRDDVKAKTEQLQKDRLKTQALIQQAEAEGRSAEKLREKEQKLAAKLAEREQALFKEDVSVFPTVVGERFTKEIPEDIRPLVDDLREVLAAYEREYKKHGMDFVRDPVERMKLWGVYDYVPHLHDHFKMPVEEHAKYQRNIDNILDDYGSGTIDRELSLSMDAQKHRALSGTISEINASVRATDANRQTNWAFTMDPQLLMARFFNSSRALSNEDFLWALNRGNVVRVFTNTQQALEQGYVPLFEKAVNHSAYGRFLEVKTPEEWAPVLTGYGEDVTEEFMKQLAMKDKKSPLVSWATDIKRMNEARTVEHALAGIRASQLRQQTDRLIPLVNGELYDASASWMLKRDEFFDEVMQKQKAKEADLIDKMAKPDIDDARKATLQGELAVIRSRFDPQSQYYKRQQTIAGNKAWKQLTQEINDYVIRINKRQETDEAFQGWGRLPSLTEKAVKLYVGEKGASMFRQYIPQGVAESMTRQFSDALPQGSKLRKSVRFLHSVNNWWKTRVTIMAIAFSVRNAVGNMFQNMMDIGVGGVLHPGTNMTATRVAQMADYWSGYGSMRKAYEEMSKPIQPGETKWAYLIRKTGAAEMKSTGMYDPQGLNTIDLGDGVLREVDDAMAMLHRNNVISGSSTFRADIDYVHNQFTEIAHALGYSERGKKAMTQVRQAMSVTEDVIVTGLGPMSAALGGVFVPVALPKKWGATVSRRVENQGRMVNFIANMKRGGTIETAAAHTNKFLMNYGDLTPQQKTWSRLLIPFFTWNQKNVLLHLDTMKQNPVYFSQFYRTVYEYMPRISEAVTAEEEGYATHAVLAERKRQQDFKYLPQYNLYKVRVPVDISNKIFMEGLGLPVEAFAQQVSSIGGLMVPFVRWMDVQSVKDASRRSQVEASRDNANNAIAQTNFILRYLIESQFMKEYTFYGRKFSDPRSRQANDMAALAMYLEQSNIPGAHLAGSALRQHLGLTMRIHPDGRAFYYIDDDKMASKYDIETLPHMRHLRNALMLADVFGTATLTERSRAQGGGTAASERLGIGWRMLNALSGVKLKQDVPDDVAYRRYEHEVKDFIEEVSDLQGITYKGRIPLPKER